MFIQISVDKPQCNTLLNRWIFNNDATSKTSSLTCFKDFFSLCFPFESSWLVLLICLCLYKVHSTYRKSRTFCPLVSVYRNGICEPQKQLTVIQNTYVEIYLHYTHCDTNVSSVEGKSGSFHLATLNYYFSFSSHSP